MYIELRMRNLHVTRAAKEIGSSVSVNKIRIEEICVIGMNEKFVPVRGSGFLLHFQRPIETQRVPLTGPMSLRRFMLQKGCSSSRQV